MTRLGHAARTVFAIGVLALLGTVGGRAAEPAGKVSKEEPVSTLYVKTLAAVERNQLLRCNAYEVTVKELGETRRVRQYHPVISAVVKCDPEFLETPRWEITWRDFDEETEPQLELSYVKAWCEGGNGELFDPKEVRLLCYEQTID